MSTHSICAAIPTDMLRPSVASQQVHSRGAQDKPDIYPPLLGTDVPSGVCREILRLSPHHRLQPELKPRLDLLGGIRTQYPFYRDGSNPNGLRRSSAPIRGIPLTLSQVHVIDAAIVRSTVDTTRHLNSYSGNCKRTSDVTQNLTSGLRVDAERQTSTYDVSNNMLSDLYEGWSNGQLAYSYWSFWQQGSALPTASVC